MQLTRRVFISLAMAAMAAGSVQAENFPSGTIKIVAPFAAGGNSDLIARVLADDLTKRLHTPVIVDNRPGAYGITAVDQVVRARPDGHTLVIHNVTTGGLTPIAYAAKAPFDLQTVIKPISRIAESGTAYIASTSSDPAFKTFDDVKKYALANPGKVRFGSTGQYSIGHFMALQIGNSMGAEFNHLSTPDGGAGLVANIMNGDFHLTALSGQPLVSLVEGGNGKILAVTSPLKSFPDAPVLSDLGLPNFGSGQNWHVLYVHSDTPDDIVNVLYKAVSESLAEPQVVKRLDKLFSVPTPSESPQSAADWLSAELQKMKSETSALGLTFQ